MEIKLAAQKILQIEAVLTALDEAVVLISAFTQTEENKVLLSKLIDNIDDVKTIVSSVDLMETTTDDINKGTYLGNRKLDIDIALNKVGIAQTIDYESAMAIWNNTLNTVYYNSATVTFVDGTIIEVPFVNDDAQAIQVSTHGAIIDQLQSNATFTAKLENTVLTEEVGGKTATLIRIADVTGHSCNVERIVLHAVQGAYVSSVPVYFWALTTSALQTLANRVGDIIALGNDIDKIIVLSSSIDEMLALQNKLSELLIIHSNLSEILLADESAASALASKNAAANSATLASEQVTLAANQVTLASQQKDTATTKAQEAAQSATTATQKANAILALTTQAIQLTSGQAPTAIYDPATGKITLGIPQGLKGDKGDAFTVNASGAIAVRVAYDGAAKGFSYLSLDENPTMIYFKKSDTVADWSTGVAFGKGDKGDEGDPGNGVFTVAFVSTTHASGLSSQSGGIDTYRMTFTDTTHADYMLYNGKDGEVTQAILDAAVLALNGRMDGLEEQVQTVIDTAIADINQTVSTALSDVQTQVDTAIAEINQTVSTAQADIATAVEYVEGLIPSQTGNAGKALVTDGTTTEWGSIETFVTGDIAISTDASRFVAPQWLECNGFNYDRTVYPELFKKTGYSGSTSAVKANQPVIMCNAILDKFSNFNLSIIQTMFYTGRGIVFNESGSVAAVYINSTTVHVYRDDNATGKYTSKHIITTQGSANHFAISKSGNWLAYTNGDGQSCVVGKWDGTTYQFGLLNSISSYGAYHHNSVAFSDSEMYIYYGTDTQNGRIYTLDTNGFATLCSGVTPPNCNLHVPFWLPNENKLVVVGSADEKIRMFSISGTVISEVGTGITNVNKAMVGAYDFSPDRKYIIVGKKISPYTEIYKVSSTGFTLIHSDVTNSNSALMYFDDTRAVRVIGDTITTQTVYSINTTNDAVTNLGNAFDSPFYSSYDGNINKWSMVEYTRFIKASYSLGYISVGHFAHEAVFKWDSTSSKYKAHCAIISRVWDISYNTTADYGIVYNALGSAFLLKLDPDTLEPLNGSLKFVQHPSVMTSNTYTQAYFTDCPDIFVCNQYTNGKLFKLDRVTEVFTPIAEGLITFSSTWMYQASPTGEFLAWADMGGTLYINGAYKNGSGVYVGTTAYLNGNNITSFGQWIDNSSLLFDDAATAGYGILNFTSLSPSTSRSNPIGTKYHFQDTKGRMFYGDDAYDYYVKFIDGTTQLLSALTSVQSVYVSPDGDYIQIGTSGWLFQEDKGVYISIGNCVLFTITSNINFRNHNYYLFNREKGVIKAPSGYQSTFITKIPLINISTTLMESQAKCYIKTGVQL